MPKKFSPLFSYLRQPVLIFSLWLAVTGTLLGVEPAAKADPKGPPPKANRLAQETSPYLLQHAHNPVDWFPWGDEALAKAKAEKKLIFLSIGYSSCHWCHVMERESFLDPEIAKYMNEHFVCIKVDREERPDIDSIYMTSLSIYNQLAGNRRGGGWPLSMFLTPEADPFFGGTYFPARDGDRGSSTGFLTVTQRVFEFWDKSPDKIREDAAQISKLVKRQLEGKRLAVVVPLDESLTRAVQVELAQQFDPLHGGFGFNPTEDRMPKFPEPANLVFLLDQVRRTKDAEALKMLQTTLEKMACGGIWDHLGEGFHRYSTDRRWEIPHFEKMLYDNGQLASVYAEAFVLTGREDFRRTALGIVKNMVAELRDKNGGFYAALDADSEGEEGKFYRCDQAEVAKLLSPEEAKQFTAIYGLNGEPNFDEKWFVPLLTKPLADPAVETTLAAIRQKLLLARSKRIRPATDTKILTADNGLMIAGLADVGRCLKEPQYIVAAEETATFILKTLCTPDGKLRRTFAQGEAKLNAYLTDYAFLTYGLLALHRATGNTRWLDEAEALTKKQLELFTDEAGGGFFFTSTDHEALLARGKEFVDGAIPAGNSVAVQNLLTLARLRKNPDYLAAAEKTLQAAASLIERSPSAAPWMAASIPLLAEVQRELKETK